MCVYFFHTLQSGALYYNKPRNPPGPVTTGQGEIINFRGAINEKQTLNYSYNAEWWEKKGFSHRVAVSGFLHEAASRGMPPTNNIQSNLWWACPWLTSVVDWFHSEKCRWIISWLLQLQILCFIFRVKYMRKNKMNTTCCDLFERLQS